MSTYNSGPQKRGPKNEVRHCKQDALDGREFELLLEGAEQMEDYYGQQAKFCILALGRLGFRRGELTHMRRSWVDRRNQMISVPYQQDCHGERDGSGICGSCRQLAKQRARVNEHVSMEEAVADQWTAKTPAAARGVYYGFDSRVELHVERFIDKYDGWPLSAGAITRRVKKAARKADTLEEENIRPHSLRATAATHHAGKGLEMHGIMQMFGWAQASTGERYLSRNSKNTARQLDSIHQG